MFFFKVLNKIKLEKPKTILLLILIIQISRSTSDFVSHVYFVVKRVSLNTELYMY